MKGFNDAANGIPKEPEASAVSPGVRTVVKGFCYLLRVQWKAAGDF